MRNFISLSFNIRHLSIVRFLKSILLVNVQLHKKKLAIKVLALFVLLTMPAFLAAQQLHRDTVSPYKLLPATIKGQSLLLSDNTQTPYLVRSTILINSLLRAIRQKDQVVIRFRNQTSEIVSLKTLPLTAAAKFKRKHQTLRLKGFKFNPQLSLIQNELKFTDTLISIQKTLKPAMPADSVAIIFDYFAGLQCNSAAECDKENPCISFDYKKNGCNARAHWMRKLLAEQFGYDCQKIFVEGSLVVTNDGSCYPGCVNWGWHVAIYVLATSADGKQVGWVIDPSLFKSPCTMADWAAAQAQTCGGDTGSPMQPYLEPSYVYTPNGSTDDDYSSTRKLLYKFCKNCHR